MVRFNHHPPTNRSVRRLLLAGLFFKATLCLVLGLGYTVFATITTPVPPAIRAISEATGVVPFGVAWLCIAGCGYLGMLFPRAERAFWWLVIAACGGWGGAYLGDAVTIGSPRVWLTATVFWVFAGGAAVIRGLADVARASQDRVQ